MDLRIIGQRVSICLISEKRNELEGDSTYEQVRRLLLWDVTLQPCGSRYRLAHQSTYGNATHLPIPGFMFLTSISESSGAIRHQCCRRPRWTNLLTEIQVRLSGEHQRFGFDAFHGGREGAIIGLLVRAVTCLPGVQHCAHVFGVW